MPELLQPPTTLYPGRIRQTLLLLVCVAFVAGGFFMARDGEMMGYVSIAFFGLGIVVFTLNFLPSAAYLRLEEDGFTFCSMFRAHTVRWADVQEFGIVYVRRTRMLGWNYVPGYSGGSKMRSVNRALVDYEASFPDSYGMKLEYLEQEMTRLRDEYWLRHKLTQQNTVL